MTQILHPNQNNSHGLACDGLQIAKDDLREIENAQKQNDAVWELFRNAARIRGAMKSNRLLRPIFRKYKRACREILQQKNDEAAQMLTLCDYCDSCDNHDGSNHDLKDIQYEMREIYDKIRGLEEMQLDTDDDDSESEFDSDNDYAGEAEDNDDDAEDNDHAEDDDHTEDADSDSISSASSASSSSSFSDLLDMENFS